MDEIVNHGIDTENRILYCTAYHSPYTEGNEGEGGINWEMADKLLKGLHILEAKSSKPITLIINSFGGDEAHARAIMAAIRGCESVVTGIVYGRAQSAAAWILQACDYRVMTEYSNLMFHMGSGTMDKHSRYNDDLYVEILLDKLKEKDSTWTKTKVKNRLYEDWYVYPSQAIALGLADEVR